MYELSLYRNGMKVCDHQLDAWDATIGPREEDDIRLRDDIPHLRAHLRWVGHSWMLTHEEDGIRESLTLTPGAAFSIGPHTALLRQHPTTWQRPVVPERLHEALGSDPKKPSTEIATLTVLTGPDAGTRWPLKAHQVTLGSLGSTITLQDSLLQPRHCRLKVVMGRVILEKGEGPVYVRSRKIDTEYPLFPGESFRIGRTRLQFNIQHIASPMLLGFGRMKGRSRRFKKLCGRLHQLAAHDVTVQLCGESGTGKTLAAQTIHEHSNRLNGPLVLFRCDEHSDDESSRTLFGEGSHDGLLHQADDGTLVLQEVGALPLDAQKRLAEVLASGRVRRLDACTGTRIDFRLITTTSQDLSALVEAGAFREDLLEDLTGDVVRLPPLRVCRGDLDCLIRHFLGSIRAAPVLTGQERALLVNHSWPGNVRELRNILRELTHDRRCLLRLVGSPDDQRSDILERLGRHQGKVRPAAMEMGLSGNGLRHRMRKLGLL